MSNLLEKAKRVIKNPKLVLQAVGQYGIYNWMPDEAYLKFMYSLKMGKKLNLDNPQTFNEKLQWLKLHNRRSEYTMMVDKYAVREYIKEKLGEEYLIPLLGVWDDPDKIDFDKLPNQFVLKCNHNSGVGMCICKDKSKLDIETVRKKLKKGLKEDYYLHAREWPYKDVPRKIIAEKYMVDNSDSSRMGLIDYKFYCFNGQVEYLYVSQGLDNHVTAKISFVTTNWEIAPFKRSDYDSFKILPPKPTMMNEMMEIANQLASGIPFIRVDLYEINGKIYFGELTFFPGGGFTALEPDEWDYTLGELIDLEKVK